MKIIKMFIKKIAVLILSCICLTSCGKINNAKKKATKIPGYIDNVRKSKITYSEKDTNRIAGYVANGEKSKFINEMSKNVMKKKGSTEKVNELFSYMDGKNIKIVHTDAGSTRNYTKCDFIFHSEKNHYYDFLFDFVPVDINDANNTGIKSFYIVEIKGRANLRNIRKPVRL